MSRINLLINTQVYLRRCITYFEKYTNKYKAEDSQPVLSRSRRESNFLLEQDYCFLFQSITQLERKELNSSSILCLIIA